MANLLFDDPNQWSNDGTTPGPPSIWDGTNYNFNGETIYYIGVINAGDAVNVLVSWADIPAEPGRPIAKAFVLTSEGGAYGQQITPASPSVASSQTIIDALTGSETYLTVSCGNLYYGEGDQTTFQVTLSPIAPIAPDETLTVPMACPNTTPATVSITPVITLGGVPFTPSNILVYAYGLPTHGTATPTTFQGLSTLTYTPDVGYSGPDSFQYTAYSGSNVSNFGTVTVNVTPTDCATWCMELGRATRCYVSGFQRNRVHECRIVRGELRCLIADFNGALPKGQLIVSATWRCWNGSVAVMSNARIKDDQRETAIDLLAALPGGGMIKVEVMNDHGEVYTQLFRVNVTGGFWFEGEPSIAQGPSTLTVEIPVVVP